jgi:uncharacterized Zn finger protein (UPF0148 family)
MGVHKRQLDEKCKACGRPLVEYHMKNPYLDDFAKECPSCEAGEAMQMLERSARADAAREHADD